MKYVVTLNISECDCRFPCFIFNLWSVRIIFYPGSSTCSANSYVTGVEKLIYCLTHAHKNANCHSSRTMYVDGQCPLHPGLSKICIIVKETVTDGILSCFLVEGRWNRNMKKTYVVTDRKEE